jgi:hypothetical protein
VAKPGRPRDPKVAGKTETVLARIAPNVRKQLEDSAKTAGHSLSREIDERLSASFEPQIVVDVGDFGTPQTYAILLACAAAIAEVEELTDERWYKNRFTYDQAIEAIVHVFEKFKPRGHRKPPKCFPVLREGFPKQLREEIRADWERQGVGRIAAGNVCLRIKLASLRSPEARAEQAKHNPQAVKAARLLRKYLTEQPFEFGFSTIISSKSKTARGAE